MKNQKAAQAIMEKFNALIVEAVEFTEYCSQDEWDNPVGAIEEVKQFLDALCDAEVI